MSIDASLILSILATCAAIGSAIYAGLQVRKVKAQLEQTSAHNLTSISNQMNWDLFDRHENMPPALPSWIGLSDKEWAWRVLHLNHLNLLKLARHDYMQELMTKSEFESWQLKARYWFQNLRAEDSSAEIQSGRNTLQQLLRPEEGYPKEFCQWLVESKIIPSDLPLINSVGAAK